MARIRLAGEVFSGYNKPKRDVQGGKQFAVAAKEGDKVRLVRFGDANMENKSDDPNDVRTFVQGTTATRKSPNSPQDIGHARTGEHVVT